MARTKKVTADAAETKVTKETAVEAENKNAEEEKAAAPKAEVKKAPAKKAAPKTEAKKAPAKKAEAAKAPAKKTEASKAVKSSVYVQFAGKEFSEKDLVEAAKSAYIALGNKASDIKTLEVYVKPEESVAYYVVNGEGSDEYKVQL